MLVSKERTISIALKSTYESGGITTRRRYWALKGMNNLLHVKYKTLPTISLTVSFMHSVTTSQTTTITSTQNTISVTATMKI